MTNVATTESDEQESLLFEVREEIGYIVFNRPRTRNAMTFAMYERLAEICRTAEDHARVLVLRGAGDKAFAAGTDISQFLDLSSEAGGLEYEARVNGVMHAIEECKIPTIAAMHGAVTGGGAAIAACCDLRIGAPSMRFGVPIARTLGNCLSIENYARFSAIIGLARVKDLIFTTRLVDADEALRIGWLTELVDEEDQLLVRAEELAKQVAGFAPLTLRATKLALFRIRDGLNFDAGADLISLCYSSADFREGVTAFLEKRPPNWTGR
jgi:enoyl-CoA hydratase